MDKGFAEKGSVEKNATQGLEGLRAQVVEVREKVVDVLTEMDHIRLQEIPSIQADYAVRIGCWEAELLRAELACRRAKRRLELVRSRTNRGEAVDVAEIDAQLDRELADWQTQVEAKLEQQASALKWQASYGAMGFYDAAEVRRVFHVLAKRLHPDLHPEDAERCRRLFEIARAAYRHGDLATLQSLEVSTRGFEKGDHDLDDLSAEELAQALELTQMELELRQQDLAALRQSPEVQLGEHLEDQLWVKRRVDELKRAIREFDEARAGYEGRLAELGVV